MLSILTLLAIVCTLQLSTSAHPYYEHVRQQTLTKELGRPIHLRPVTEADLDDITTVIIDAFGPGEAARYTQPQRDQYKEYEWRCTREAIGKQWEHRSNSTFANVIAVPTHGCDSDEAATTRKERVVAVGVWQIKHQHDDQALFAFNPARLGPGEEDCAAQLHVNTTRAEDLVGQFSAAEKKWIEDAYDEQLYLSVLATHPDWDGNNFGAAQCAWGFDLAGHLGLPVTLMGTPAGYPLYDSLGFRSVHNVTIQMLDDLGVLWYEVMEYTK